MSSNRRRVAWRLVLGGVAIQFVLAFAILGTRWGLATFSFLGDLIRKLLQFVDAGSRFMFAAHPPEGVALPAPSTYPLLWTFAFSVLPTVIFFSSLMSVLYYLGVMQWLVRGMGWVMQKTLKTSGAESLAAAANIFVGHTEAPLVVRPYLEGMTLSELNAVMVGGFATISTGLLAVFADRGISPEHLIAASVISAPAALLVAKLMEPETGEPQTMGTVPLDLPRRGVNVVEAAAVGASEGLQLALNIGAMLIAFLALIAMSDALLGWVGRQFGYVDAQGAPLWTLDRAFGLAFAPLAWLMGIAWDECNRCGQLLGIKLVANEFLAYERLGEWKRSGDPLSLRSEVIMTYALAGFSNFGAIGIQIGGIGGLAPSRRSDLARLGLRAMLGGAIACCMTACVAGIVAPQGTFLKPPPGKSGPADRPPTSSAASTSTGDAFGECERFHASAVVIGVAWIETGDAHDGPSRFDEPVIADVDGRVTNSPVRSEKVKRVARRKPATEPPAATQTPRINLLVGVAREPDIDCGETDLSQSRTVDAGGRLASPPVGRSQKPARCFEDSRRASAESLVVDRT